MMPTMSFSFLNAAFTAAIPTLTVSFPYSFELAALVPIGFAVGLFTVLIEAMRANRRAEQRARPTAVPARTAA
jgi:hypothetical protein